MVKTIHISSLKLTRIDLLTNDDGSMYLVGYSTADSAETERFRYTVYYKANNFYFIDLTGPKQAPKLMLSQSANKVIAHITPKRCASVCYDKPCQTCGRNAPENLIALYLLEKP